MVLAHELAHVFSLQLSRSRVPRWFTEGLAELETARLRPEWRRQADLELAAALSAGQAARPLGAVAGVRARPRTAGTAALAYLHAAAAVEFLERSFGFARIREALVAWAAGTPDEQVLEQLAGMPVARLDERFRADLDKRLGPLRAQLRGYEQARKAGLEAVRAGDRPAALRQLRAAVAAAPGSIEAKALLAEQLSAMGDEEARWRSRPRSCASSPRADAGQAGGAGARARRPRGPGGRAGAGRAVHRSRRSRSARRPGAGAGGAGQDQRGRRALEQALLFGPADPCPLHRALADLYEKLGDPRKAASHRRPGRRREAQ